MKHSGIACLVSFLGFGSFACGEGMESAETTDLSYAKSSFNADFSGCTEMAGIGLVPQANARALVPAQYTLAGDANNAVIVVRVASCTAASLDGGSPSPEIVAQLGISLVPPDGTGDINNYTLWYHTTDAQLHARFTSNGLKARHVSGMSYTFTPNGSGTGTLHVASSHSADISFDVTGSVTAPTSPATIFNANWWAPAKKKNEGMKMATAFPNIHFGAASMTLTTPAGGELADLIGGTTLTFPLLDSYNSFDPAHMDVSIF